MSDKLTTQLTLSHSACMSCISRGERGRSGFLFWRGLREIGRVRVALRHERRHVRRGQVDERRLEDSRGRERGVARQRERPMGLSLA